MKRTAALLAAVVALASCEGNPFGRGGDDGGGADGVTVPDGLRGAAASQTEAVFLPGANGSPDRLRINIPQGPTNVSTFWERRPQLDVSGYSAFVYQSSPLSRSFIGFGARSSGTNISHVSTAVAGDGGQFNRDSPGALFQRVGTFNPPPTGSVSYSGRYVGVSNAPTLPDLPIAPQPPSDPALPGLSGSRVVGDVFMNADYNPQIMTIEGAVVNRELVDFGIPLESVIFVQTRIEESGQFTGMAERPERYVTSDGVIAPGAPRETVGDFGGVIGGPQAGSIAGILVLSRVYVDDGTGSGPLLNAAANETGIFVLERCTQTNADPICSYALPPL